VDLRRKYLAVYRDKTFCKQMKRSICIYCSYIQIEEGTQEPPENESNWTRKPCWKQHIP